MQVARALRSSGPVPSVQRSFRQHNLQSRNISRLAGFGFLSNLFGGSTTKREGKNDGVLNWARNVSMGTQLACNEAPPGLELGTFAGGCFWGLELKFQREPGVKKTSVGYAQGQKQNPTYEEVCSGRTGHTEAVQVTFDPKETSFERLLDAFAEQIDLTTLNRQGGDRGTQYRSGIYYHSEDQKAAIEKFYSKLNDEIKAGKRRWAGGEVVAEAEPIKEYYVAEDYHQQYLSTGGRFGTGQSAEKGCTDKIRCYG